MQGELPLELQFLELVRKHGIRIHADVSGSIALETSSSLFDPIGTTTVTLALEIGKLQELGAQAMLVPARTKSNAMADTVWQFRFTPETLAIRDPQAFPARIGASSPVGTRSPVFVLDSFTLTINPVALARAVEEGPEALAGLGGTFFLRDENGAEGAPLTELDFTFSSVKKRKANLWDSKDWLGMVGLMDQMAIGASEDLSPMADPAFGGGIPPGGDNPGGDDLVLVPEASAFPVLAGALALLLCALPGRSNHSRRARG